MGKNDDSFANKLADVDDEEALPSIDDGPLCLVVVGAAGSGKSTFCNAFYRYVNSQERPVRGDVLTASPEKKVVYSVNLDPAATQDQLNFNLDIRRSVDYKAVMKKYRLGPNGAVITALNLYSTKFDSVLEKIDSRISVWKNKVEQRGTNPSDENVAPEPDLEFVKEDQESPEEPQPKELTEADKPAIMQADYIIVDTPGQLEVFTWSASGTLILESLGVSLPTAVVYVLDSQKCENPTSFTSNMLYACSVMYKSRLPFMCVMNKRDSADIDLVKSWFSDFEKLAEEAVLRDSSYYASLTRSIALSLQRFYENIYCVPVSSVSLEGFPKLIESLSRLKSEYRTFYEEHVLKPREEKIQKELSRFRQDVRNAK